MKRLLFSLLVASCTASPASPEVGATAAAIVGGVPSDDAQNAVVLVMHYDALAKGGGAASGCSGTLLAPTLVLTARHCVSETDPGAACSSKGQPLAGGAVKSDFDPSKLYVFGGKKRPNPIADTIQPSIGVAIVTTGAKNLCNNDLALIMLDRPVAGATIAPIRLDVPPDPAEHVTLVGWGISESDVDPPVRLQRTDVAVEAVGPAEALGPAEFRVGEGTCAGDSGGPSLAASGAVLGALSRGGSSADVDGAAGCLHTSNIFTSVAAYADLIRDAYAKVGQEPWLEGGPNPLLAKVGAACAADADCQTNACDSGRKVCADACASGSCPGGHQQCLAQDRPGNDQGPRKLCVPMTDDSGCMVGRTSPPSTGLSASLILCTLAVLFAVGRRQNLVSGQRPGRDQNDQANG